MTQDPTPQGQQREEVSHNDQTSATDQVRTTSQTAENMTAVVSAYVVDSAEEDDLIRSQARQIGLLSERFDQMNQVQFERLLQIVEDLDAHIQQLQRREGSSSASFFDAGSSRDMANEESGGGILTAASRSKKPSPRNRVDVKETVTGIKVKGGVYSGDVLLQPKRILRLGNPYMRHGTGTMTYKAGDTYVGQWYHDKREGQGTYTRPDGKEYSGEWKHDYANGNGVMKSEDGSVYTGKFKNHKRHGSGVLVKSDGSCFEGDWLDDCQHGKGTYTSPDGRKYEVLYRDGRLIKKT